MIVVVVVFVVASRWFVVLVVMTFGRSSFSDKLSSLDCDDSFVCYYWWELKRQSLYCLVVIIIIVVMTNSNSKIVVIMKIVMTMKRKVDYCDLEKLRSRSQTIQQRGSDWFRWFATKCARARQVMISNLSRIVPGVAEWRHRIDYFDCSLLLASFSGST